MENKPKINYYLQSLETLKTLDGQATKPRLLLHACCGPCSTFPLVFLCEYFDVTIYYNNSNIYPESEYHLRLEELKKFVVAFEQDFSHHIELIIPNYENEPFTRVLEPFKDEPEGHHRCQICYAKRMGEAYDFAEANGYEYFTTVMTISRQKNSQILNEIGLKLEQKHPKTKYFYSDFKKNKGLEKVKEMKEKYEMYQQLYCGCKFSYEAYQTKLENRKNEEKNDPK